MNKSKVAAILAGYSPPLSAGQVDAISLEIAKISTAEIAEAVKKVSAAFAVKTVKPAGKPKHRSQSHR